MIDQQQRLIEMISQLTEKTEAGQINWTRMNQAVFMFNKPGSALQASIQMAPHPKGDNFLLKVLDHEKKSPTLIIDTRQRVEFRGLLELLYHAIEVDYAEREMEVLTRLLE